MNVVESFKALEINADADFAAAKAAHRQMIKQFHPDRFANNNEARLSAEERCKIINVAFATLEIHFAECAADFKPAASEFKSNYEGTFGRTRSPWEAQPSYGRSSFHSRREPTRSERRWNGINAAVKAFHGVLFVCAIGYGMVHYDFSNSVQSVKNFSITKIMKSL